MLGFVPVLMPFTGVFIGILCQTPVLLLATKVHRFGALTLLGLLTGVLTGLTSWPAIVTGILFGLIADIIANAGKFRNRTLLIVAAGVFNIWSYGKYFMFFFGRDAYMKEIAAGYGQDYVDQISGLFPMWMAWALPIILLVSGIIGGWIATKLMRKHFERAGLA
jgi:energy-coupling factor transport system substrate-specific component